MQKDDWSSVRAEFDQLDPELTTFAAMTMTSHPVTVRRAIDKHRRELDTQPHDYVMAASQKAEAAVAVAAGRYFGVAPPLIATTGSTTMGLAQIYGGLVVKPGDEILTSTHEHFTTLHTLQGRRRRDGLQFRRIPLFTDTSSVTADEIVTTLEAEVRPTTRALALTWVHSNTGLKMPIADIAAMVKRENLRRRSSDDALLLCVDGVHGFGIEADTFDALGCDLFVAGCHKWIFGPRGTGIICGTEAAWGQVVPIVPTFSGSTGGPGPRHSPGGIHAYEHFWALNEAFKLHQRWGKPRILKRVRWLARQLKEALSEIDGLTLRTPVSDELSSGIVCFDLDNWKPEKVLAALRKEKIIATVSGWDPTTGRHHPRLSVSVLNNPAEIERVATVLHRLTAG